MHGEIAPQIASILFSPAVWIASRQPLAHNRFHRVTLALAVCCFGLGWFVFYMHIRMGYTDWMIARGIVQNPHAKCLLLGYLGFTVLVGILAACFPFKHNPTTPPC